MITINLNEFIDKVQAYQSSSYALENLYSETLKRDDVWKNLAKINEQQTSDVILKFLNAWKCRLSYKCAPNLAKTLRDSSGLLTKLNCLSLQDVSLDFIIADDNIQEAFRNIASVQAGRRTVGATATSKIMHMINPNFFVMSDENIRYGYGCCGNDLGYVNFMWRMKLFCDAIIKEYSDARKEEKDFAFRNLASECKSAAPTLPKLLDEYNWVKYNP